MRDQEAQFIGAMLAQLPCDTITPCLNLGSSTRRFREVSKPHIHRYLISPLESRSVRVVHSDLKQADGVDIAGDFSDPQVFDRIRQLNPSLVLCCNMFEHVVDRVQLASMISGLVKEDGYAMVTVPFSYPLHYDPIDTYYRPTPEELAKLFPDFRIVNSHILSDTTYLQDLLKEHSTVSLIRHFAMSGLKFFAVWRGKKKWVSHFHRYFWLFRPYKVTCLLLQKIEPLPDLT